MASRLSWLTPHARRPSRAALTAAARIISEQSEQEQSAYRSRLIPDEQEWQREVWGFYDSLGMFRNAVTWKSDMLSRVRLKAARKDPGQDEPEILADGPAAEIMSELSTGLQATILANLAVYLAVPGEGYLIGETIDGVNRWQARSVDEVRYRATGNSRMGGPDAESPFEIIDERTGGNTVVWRHLVADSLVVRVWRPHKRYFHLADSNARSARATMRELELANRHIQAMYMSRLASAGAFLLPSEVTFPVRPEFADAPDPFMLEWIEIAAQAIKTPGSAAAMVPMPMRMPGEYLDKAKYVDFTSKLDEKIIEKRSAAVQQLAVDLDVPPQSLLGHSETNHWTAWLVEESGFKVYLAPDVELICNALTTGFLVPRLLAAGESVENIVAWYDASEITLRPDRSANSVLLYDRGEATGDALRRETGLDVPDKPTDDELTQIILKKIALAGGANSLVALEALTGKKIDMPAPAAQPGDQPAGPQDEPAPVDGPPPGPGDPGEGKPGKQPKAPGEPPIKEPSLAVEVSQLLRQAGLQHALRINGMGATTLLHPLECGEHLMSCPVTTATWGNAIRAHPGSPGVYACWLSPHGVPELGQKLADSDTKTMLPTLSVVG